jgi:hypothetical protein
MYTEKTVFAQLMKFMPEYEFQKCVDHYKGDYRVRTLTCREHFLVMSFAQLSGRESLRDIENCLTAFSGKLYHSGINNPVSRSTIDLCLSLFPCAKFHHQKGAVKIADCHRQEKTRSGH